VDDVSSSSQTAAAGWSLYVAATDVGAKTGLDIRGTTVAPKF
jgi:hypothetical protein